MARKPARSIRMPTYPQKITFGEMREAGVRDVLIYCRDHRCAITLRRALTR